MKLDFTSDINRGFEAGLNYPKKDRFVVAVHWWSFAAVALLAFANSVLRLAERYESALAWRVVSTTEAFWTVVIAFLVTIVPTLLKGRVRNHYLWRILVSFTLSTYSLLGIFLSGGAIEMHFYLFASLALIAMYADWRLGWFSLVYLGGHHLILNFLTPGWLFFYGRSDLSVVAHALPALITVIFTTMSCNLHRMTIQQIQTLRADLRSINEALASGENRPS